MVGEAGVPGHGGLGHDGVRPVVIVGQRRDRRPPRETGTPPWRGTSVSGETAAVSKVEQAPGELCVRDEAMDKPSSDRGKDR